MSKGYIKSGAWYLFGNLLIKGVSFFTLPMFTRILSTDDFGKFNVFLSFENIVSIIIGLGIAGTVKIAYFDYKEKFDEYISSVIGMLLIVTIVIDILVNIIVCISPIINGGFWDSYHLNLLIIYSLATALYNLISTIYVIKNAYKQNLAISFAYTVSSVLLSLLFCFTIYTSAMYDARIVGNAMPLIVITYGIAITHLIKNKFSMNREHWKYALILGVPLIFHSLALVVMQQADIIMVNMYTNAAQTGIYSLACNIALILSIIQSSLDNAWAPWYYNNLNEERYACLIKKNNVLTALFALITCSFNLLAPEIIFITSPASYHTSIYCLVPLNISIYVSFMYMFLINKEYFFKSTKLIALGTIVATTVDVALNMIFIPEFGFSAAAYTTLFSNFVLYGMHYKMSFYIDKRKVVGLKESFFCLAIVIFVSFLSLLFINYLLIRMFALFMIFSIGIGRLKKHGIYFCSFKKYFNE